MTVLTWLCIVIDVIVAVVLLFMLTNPNQDAAGKGMIFLPVVLLLICAGAAWLLMNKNYRITAFVISAAPAIISMYVLFLTVKES